MATRRERVVLDLESNLPEGMLRGAAATTVLRKELERLSGQSVITSRASANMSRDVDKMSTSSTKAEKSINQLTGRLRLFADIAATLGPALVPLGGVAIAGVAGLSAQMGVAAVAGGVLIGSMQGVGDALGALNDAHLEPTAENLAKVEAELAKLSPAAADFAREAYALMPALRAIRDAGAEGLFPGLTDSLDDLERLAPVVATIFERVGSALGEIASDSAASLASDRWADFFEFIATEAPSALTELASTVGSLTHGMAELWQAFTPLNRDFSSWLDGVAKGFDDWATGLSETEGFRDFVGYIRETGPQVAETLGALANALVQMVQAAAPLGGPILQAIEAVADVLAGLANSSAGPVLFTAAAGFSAISRAMAGFDAVKGSRLVATLQGVSTNADGAARSMSGFERAAAGLAGVTIAFVAIDELNKRLDETLPGLEAVKSQLIGLTEVAPGFSALGLSDEFDSLAESINRISSPDVTDGVQGMFDAIAPGDNRAKSLREATAEIDALDLALANLVASGSADVAAEALERLAEEQGLSTEQVQHLKTLLPGYGEALQGQANNADLAAASTEGHADAMADAAEKTNTFRESLSRLNSLLDGRADMRDYQAAIDDFTASIKKNGNTFDINTEKGRENQAMLDGIVGSTLAVADGMRGANRQKFLTNAISDLRTMADQMGVPKSEIAGLIESLKQANKTNVDPKINVETSPAMNNINALEARLRAIKDESVNVVVRTINTGDTQLGPRNKAADGATVPKTGKPYADRHLYLLADGEEVISNRHGQADRYRPLLKSINANRRLAEGGTAGDDEDTKDGKKKRRPRNYFSITDNTKALEAAIERLTGVSLDQTAAVEAQRYALEQATEASEMWADRMSDLAKATVSGFNTGLFARDSNVWAAGSGGGPIRNLTGDIAGLNERANLQGQLAGMGLSGEALAALLSEGDNADIAALIASGQVSQYADLYAQRAALQGSVGSSAGELAFGKEYAAARAYEERQFGALQEQLATQQRTEAKIGGLEARMRDVAILVDRLNNNDAPERTGREVGRVINEGAASAWRAGNK